MTTRRLPRTPRDFVRWCVDNGHKNVLVGTVQHDIRNLKSIANRYGYVWNDKLSRLENIQSTAMAIEEMSDKSTEATEKVEVKSTELTLKVIKKAKDYVPAAVGTDNWGSW